MGEANEILPREDAMPWLSLSLASESLRLSLDLSKARHLRPSKPSKRLSAASRSSNSRLMRITKTKTAWVNWPTSFNPRLRPTRSRLKRLKSLLLSTWLSSARLNKSLRRLKRGLRWLELNFLLSAKPLLPCKLAFVDSTSSLPVFPYHQQQVAYSMFTLFINRGIIIDKYSSYSIMNKEYY